MVSKISSILAMLVAIVVASSGQGHAVEAVRSDIPVAYGLLLDGKDAVYGEFVCHIHVRCKLIDNQKAHLQLSVTIESTEWLSGEVSVQCGEPDCSFLSGHSSTRLEGAAQGKNSRQFELYAGSGAATTNDLVYRTRPSIGRIFFLFGNR
ncbi:hypothetical protein [Rhizobium lusitanum]|uniref:Uncharacterized protein n=1 Tax=Rhizobium lusitanum TaxID=293958 RepID=A0A7X0MFF5_9HYPH|nr:hypothetical protein [Rhizobium lusitanum]MBB6488709.1 hypothetical protein [Rhizobium lusitanum]